MTNASYDVAVVGAGPAGAATALRLARAGRRVALLEQSDFDRPRVGESLAPAVQPLLREAGLWQAFLALGPLPSYGTRSLWGTDTMESHSHLMTPWGSGWHVDRVRFDRMLASAACSAGAELMSETTVVRCDASSSGFTLRAEQSEDSKKPPLVFELDARVLIDATGRAARLARWVGARRLLFDRLVAVAAELDGIFAGEQGYVMVETAPDGWWYTAPVPENRLMVMLMTDGDLCGRWDLARPAAWQARLHGASASLERARGARRWGPRVLSAVSQRLVRSERSAPWLAVGDAALAVDPITGSGVCRALRSARAAAETACALLDGAGPSAIAEYEDQCDADCTTYLEERASYYGFEQRYAKAPFWKRRSREGAETSVTPG